MSTGSIFMDWQQVERESRLFAPGDFDWSEPPRRRRRISEAATPIRRRREVPPARAESWDHPTSAHSHFDEMMAQWNAEYGDGARRDPRPTPAPAFDLSDPGGGDADGARRTVLITGRGDERYMPALRRPRQAELRFHERSGFSPDRAGLWAVLLGIALIIGAIAH